jgi:hypothetical protein
MFSDLLFVLIAVSAIIFTFSSPKPEKIQSGIAEVVGSNPTRSIFINLVKYGIMLSFTFGYCRTNLVMMAPSQMCKCPATLSVLMPNNILTLKLLMYRSSQMECACLTCLFSSIQNEFLEH